MLEMLVAGGRTEDRRRAESRMIVACPADARECDDPDEPREAKAGCATIHRLASGLRPSAWRILRSRNQPSGCRKVSRRRKFAPSGRFAERSLGNVLSTIRRKRRYRPPPGFFSGACRIVKISLSKKHLRHNGNQPGTRTFARLEHDPRKWEPVSRKRSCVIKDSRAWSHSI